MLDFKSDNPSSNPAEFYNFRWNLLLKSTKINKNRPWFSHSKRSFLMQVPKMSSLFAEWRTYQTAIFEIFALCDWFLQSLFKQKCQNAVRLKRKEFEFRSFVFQNFKVSAETVFVVVVVVVAEVSFVVLRNWLSWDRDRGEDICIWNPKRLPLKSIYLFVAKLYQPLLLYFSPSDWIN